MIDADHRQERQHKHTDYINPSKPLPILFTSSGDAVYGASATARSQEQKQSRHKPFQKWLAANGVGVATLIALVFYTVYTARQWHQMKRAADAAKNTANTAYETMKLAYRPRVTLLGINPLAQSMINGKLVTTLNNGRLKVGIDLPNNGPFPARNVRFFRFDNISPHDQITKLPYEELMGEPKVIPPKVSNSGTGLAIFGKRKVSNAELIQLQKGNLWATFSILVIYNDDFGDTHHTEYCGIFTLQPYNDVCPWPVQND